MSNEEFAGKKILVVASFGSANPERCPGPFVFAGEAARGGAEAGIVFVLQAPLILKQGVAENLCAKPGGRTIREFVDEALGAGVKFYVCDTALALCNMTPEDLIEEAEDLVGPSFLIKEGLKADLVLSF